MIQTIFLQVRGSGFCLYRRRWIYRPYPSLEILPLISVEIYRRRSVVVEMFVFCKFFNHEYLMIMSADSGDFRVPRPEIPLVWNSTLLPAINEHIYDSNMYYILYILFISRVKTKIFRDTLL